VISSLNRNALEPMYHQAAKAVLAGTAQSSRQLLELLRPMYVDDARFEQDFALLSLDTPKQRKSLAKYILARLEHDASGRACDPDTDPASIEHILPENPLDEWAEYFPRQYWDEAVYRLGNLTSLEPSLNRRVGNSTYGEKIEVYAHSSYAITRRISELAPER
jgi:hypothetical protein